ncbi:MAG: hypothetical protein IPK08_17125 [Bacteroidetes bacterium]|nr:hypothetical protein [Bacteroidota bacterium]
MPVYAISIRSPTFYLTSFGINDGFIAKLDNNGEFIFAKQIGGTTNDKISSMAMDQHWNLYTTGNFGLTADFDPGPGIENMSSYGENDIFIANTIPLEIIYGLNKWGIH